MMVNRKKTGLVSQKTLLFREMIQDFVIGAGYSYSRIAHRINVSPSTIQKLATFENREPRHHIFRNVIHLYCKVFLGTFRSPEIEMYLQAKSQQTLALIQAVKESFEEVQDVEVKNNSLH